MLSVTFWLCGSVGDDKEVQVRWTGNWDKPVQWVKLAWNPDLAKHLTRNRANPHSSTLASVGVLGSPLPH